MHRCASHHAVSRSILRGLCKPLVMTGGATFTTSSTKLHQSWNLLATVRNNNDYPTIAPPFLISRDGLGRRSLTERSAATTPKVAPTTTEEELSTIGGVGTIEATAQDFYDNSNAINVHSEVWGDTIHIGRYDLLKGKDANLKGKARMQRASELATEMLLKKAFPEDGPPPSECTMMDMGSSNGTLARNVVKNYGCTVVCIELAAASNIVNSKRSAAAGLSEKIIIPGERSYFDTQMPASSMDIVVSQEAFVLASTEHHRAIKEVARVLRPGGIFVFSDLMRSDAADEASLIEVYKNCEIVRMASPGSYRAWGDEFGLEFVEYNDYTPNFATQFISLLEMMEDMNGSIVGVEPRFMDWMKVRYSAWVKAAKHDLLSCGVMVFKKRADQE